MMSITCGRALTLAAAVSITLVVNGCQTRYMTPGGPADFRALGIAPAHAEALTDAAISEKLARKPAASFPASIVLIRLQAPNYRTASMGDQGVYGSGNASVVTVRDVESEVSMDELTSLPMVRGVSNVNRFVVPNRIAHEIDLRGIAADLHGDIVFAYTFDTRFRTETIVPALGFFTLGLFPSKEASVTTTCSGVFMDTRTGYIYGLAEATADTSQLANSWTSTDAVEQSRRRVERRSFREMVDAAKNTWTRIASTYGPPAAVVTPTAQAK